MNKTLLWNDAVIDADVTRMVSRLSGVVTAQSRHEIVLFHLLFQSGIHQVKIYFIQWCDFKVNELRPKLYGKYHHICRQPSTNTRSSQRAVKLRLQLWKFGER